MRPSRYRKNYLSYFCIHLFFFSITPAMTCSSAETCSWMGFMDFSSASRSARNSSLSLSRSNFSMFKFVLRSDAMFIPWKYGCAYIAFMSWTVPSAPRRLAGSKWRIFSIMSRAFSSRSTGQSISRFTIF